MNRIGRFAMRAPIGLYRVGLGGLLGRRFVLLEHTGHRSGLPRQTVLEVLEIDDHGVPVIANGFGEGTHWYRNITADPKVNFTIGRTRSTSRADRLNHADAVAVFERYRRDHPRAAKAIGGRVGVSLVDDLGSAARHIPLFRLVHTSTP